MCLPFLCGGHEHDQGPGAHQHQRQPATPPRSPFPDRGDGGYQYDPAPVNGGAGHGYAGASQNFGAGDAYAHGRAPGGNGEAGAAFYYSDTDAPPASVGVVRGRRQGAAFAPAPQTPELKEAVVPTPTSAGAPGKRGVANARVPQPHVAPGGWQYHGQVAAASQPKQSAMLTAPVPQVVRRGEDDDGSADVASRGYSRWK